MTDALEGFAGAFRKISRHYRLDAPEELVRVVGFQKGSAKISMEVADWVMKNPGPAEVFVTAGGLLTAGVYKVLTDIAGVIRGNKALQGQPFMNNNYTFNDNRITVRDIALTPQQFEFLQSGELDFELDRMTALLRQNRGVDEFELRVDKQELVRVAKAERPYLERRTYAAPTSETHPRRKMVSMGSAWGSSCQ